MDKIAIKDILELKSLEPKWIETSFKGVKVRDSISTDMINNIVKLILSSSEEGSIYNVVLLDMYFHLYLVFAYTNIDTMDIPDNFNDGQLFDLFQSSGLLNEILIKIPKEQYEALADTIKKQVELQLKYGSSAGALIAKFINDLPRNAQAAREIVDSFDKEKFKEVIDFATYANGGRNINTNKPVEE